mgnify:CR=1 FL=1
MAGITSAVVAAAVALIGIYFTQFLAERYRRHHDGSALAAGLAGELASHAGAAPHIRVSLELAQDKIKAGKRDELTFRALDKPQDRYFEKVVEKVGLLGPELAQGVIYVYSNLDAFRTALVLIHSNHADMKDAELLGRIALCSEAMERALEIGPELIEKLRARSAQRFNSIR